MAKIISFARTTSAFIARRKTVTRRNWQDSYFARWKDGDPFQAWSASPRVKGAIKVGEGRIVTVRREWTSEMPEDDYEAEGFTYMDEHGIAIGKELACIDFWKGWRERPELLTTVRFEVTAIEPGITPEMFWPGVKK